MQIRMRQSMILKHRDIFKIRWIGGKLIEQGIPSLFNFF